MFVKLQSDSRAGQMVHTPFTKSSPRHVCSLSRCSRVYFYENVRWYLPLRLLNIKLDGRTRAHTHIMDKNIIRHVDSIVHATRYFFIVYPLDGEMIIYVVDLQR